MAPQTRSPRQLARRHQRLITNVDTLSHLAFRQMAREMPGVLRLSSGEPDLPTPEHVITAMQDALVAGQTRCTPPQGMVSLRTAAAEAIQACGGPTYDPQDELIVTSGTTQGLYLALQVLLEPGDEVMYFEPSYPPFIQTILAAGGLPMPVPSHAAQNFVPDATTLAAAVTPATRVLLLISPGNPTGAVIDRATGEAIARVASAHDLIVITDELYAPFLYDGARYLPFAAFPGMRERTVTLSGPSKMFSLTGMRVGFLAAPAWLAQAVATWREIDSVCTTSISQHAALAALTGPPDVAARALAIYAARRRLIQARLVDVGVPHNFPHGGAFLLADIRATGFSSLDFCTALLHEQGVLISPGSEYGDGAEGWVRFSYFTPDDVLAGGLTRFGAFMENQSGQMS